MRYTGLMQRLKGSVMVFLSALAFGSYGIWTKMLGTDFGPFYAGWMRSVIVLVFLIPLVFLLRQYKKVEKGDWGWIMATIAFGIFTQVPLYYAFQHMELGTATLLFFSAFLLTSYLIGYVFLSERLTAVKAVSFLLACAGLVAIFGFSLGRFSVLALLAAIANGIASGGEVASSKMSTRKYSSLQVTLYVWIAMVVTHLPLSLLLGETQLVPGLSTQWIAMYAFAFAGIVGFWLVVEGFKFVEASIGGLIGLLEIVFSIAFGIFVFHEVLTLPMALGAALILAAAMLPDVTDLLRAR